MALFIREDEVRSLLPMEAALEAVEGVFRLKGENRADNRPRQRPRIERAMLQAMPGAVAGVGLGLKAYTVTPSGVRYLVLLWDEASGELLALLEAGELGRIRTGAASGVATRHLAREECVTVGLLGAGFQAASQLEAMCAVRPIREARVYCRSEARRRTFAEENADRLGIAINAVGSPEEAAECDIVVTITNAANPLFPAGSLKEGAHVNAAGSNRGAHAEIGADVLQRAARIFIDDREQGRSEAGDIIRAVSEGAITWNRVQELSELLAGRAGGRGGDSEITLFESLGVAIEDIAVARYVYDRAVEQGAGTPMPASAIG